MNNLLNYRELRPRNFARESSSLVLNRDLRMSISHLILLFLILLLIFGPSRLEGLGSSLGKAIHGFKKGLEEGAAGEQKVEQKADTTPPNNTPTTKA